MKQLEILASALTMYKVKNTICAVKSDFEFKWMSPLGLLKVTTRVQRNSKTRIIC